MISQEKTQYNESIYGRLQRFGSSFPGIAVPSEAYAVVAAPSFGVGMLSFALS